MRISIKGQVTIPIELRTKFGLIPETEVAFAESQDGVLLYKPKSVQLQKSKNDRGNRLVKYLTGRGTVNLSTDEIMRLMRS